MKYRLDPEKYFRPTPAILFSLLIYISLGTLVLYRNRAFGDENAQRKCVIFLDLVFMGKELGINFHRKIVISSIIFYSI